ncbi:baseplate J/gp47 family protein [Psychrilyobacter sp.]|uniref:baseplate J/gp47 family protein n=1 Tax=Psychrilyobacter sp. TaxID=2586924 RepID=UPI00301AE4C3
MSDLNIHNESSEDIAARMVTKFGELRGASLGLADERRWLLQAVAYGLFIRNETTNEGLKMNLLRYTKGDYATEMGAFTDTERLSASKSSVTLRFEIEEAKTELIGVSPIRVTPGNNIYFLTPYFEFQPGEIIKDVIGYCTEEGEIGNGFLSGEINKIVDPFTFFKTVVNTEISQGGTEIESDESLKERIRIAPSKFSTAGPGDGYIYWAKTANQGVVDVNVKMTTPGTVRITPLMEGGELPSDSVLSDVLTTCSADKRRPLTDNLLVNKPAQIDYDIDFTYYISSKDIGLVNEIQDKVNKAVTEYTTWQKAVLKRDISPTELNYLIRSAGAKRVEIVKPTFATVDVFEVAKEVNINPIYGGIEDD